MVAHRWEVAPLHQVRLMSGHVLRAGDVVRPEHFEHEDEKRQPGLLIQRLVSIGVVIESAAYTGGDDGPAAA